MAGRLPVPDGSGVGGGAVEREADFELDLPVGDLLVFDVGAGLDDLGPAHVSDGLGGLLDGAAGGVVG